MGSVDDADRAEHASVLDSDPTVRLNPVDTAANVPEPSPISPKRHVRPLAIVGLATGLALAFALGYATGDRHGSDNAQAQANAQIQELQQQLKTAKSDAQKDSGPYAAISRIVGEKWSNAQAIISLYDVPLSDVTMLSSDGKTPINDANWTVSSARVENGKIVVELTHDEDTAQDAIDAASDYLQGAGDALSSALSGSNDK